ncbi:hypothetical protein [Bradyrhizobium sp. 25ACV]
MQVEHVGPPRKSVVVSTKMGADAAWPSEVGRAMAARPFTAMAKKERQMRSLLGSASALLWLGGIIFMSLIDGKQGRRYAIAGISCFSLLLIVLFVVNRHLLLTVSG